MASEAKVRSIDALQHWRSSLIVYQTKARRGLSQVTEEVKRTRQWLETEQKPYWELQIKKLSRKLDQAQQELITARFSTLRATLLVQEQAVRKAKAALQHAEAKLRQTKLWCRDYDRAVEPLVRRLESFSYYLEYELPKGIALMEQLLRSLEGYTATTLSQPTLSTEEPADSESK